MNRNSQPWTWPPAPPRATLTPATAPCPLLWRLRDSKDHSRCFLGLLWSRPSWEPDTGRQLIYAHPASEAGSPLPPPYRGEGACPGTRVTKASCDATHRLPKARLRMKAPSEGGRRGRPGGVSFFFFGVFHFLSWRWGYRCSCLIPEFLVRAENKPQQHVATQPHCGE